MQKANLEQIVTGRQTSLFQYDLEVNKDNLKNAIQDKSILVIGAAGSIGSAFVKVLLEYSPAGVCLIDPSENNLVEIVRDIRSSGIKITNHFSTLAINFGTTEFESFIKSSPPFDYILNFAAMKHVRSERDPFSLMRLLHVNVTANQHLLSLLNSQTTQRVFAVSSDKAVNPHNCMGASKALMERVFLERHDQALSFSSARFANVTFSDGSLLHGFRYRLEKQQPLSAPSNIKRYFISHQEAGELCFLSCFHGKTDEIYVPRMNPDDYLMTFSEVAENVLMERGLTPKYFDTDEEALECARSLNSKSKEWPCVFSLSNTSGEKPFEEFIADSENVNDHRYSEIRVLSNITRAPQGLIHEFTKELEELYSSNQWLKKDLVNLLQKVVPEFEHEELGMNLDKKM